MADKGTITTVNLYQTYSLSGFIQGELHIHKGTITTRSHASPVNVLVDYALAGTLQPDAGNPPPTRGQIWPRGNITQS